LYFIILKINVDESDTCVVSDTRIVSMHYK